MSDRKPGESFEDFVKRRIWESGSFWSPNVPEGHDLSLNDLKALKLTDSVVVAGLIEMTKMDAAEYTKHTLRHHGRLPHFDGVAGPAVASMLQEDVSCPVPNHAPPEGVEFQYEDPYVQEVALRMQRNVSMATGSGNWPNCHGIGDFHCAAIRVNPAGMGSFLQPLFLQVLNNVQRAYAGVGLLFKFISMDGQDMITGENFSGNINSDMSFLTGNAPYIGIAIVGQNEDCNSRIWNRYVSSYKGGTTNEQIVTQWSSLVRHELGHNCSLQHTSGGTMNPSIINGLPDDVWHQTDPSTSRLRALFGGVPVPIPGGDPTPDPDPAPPNDVQRQLFEIHVKNATQDAAIEYFASRTNSIDERLRKLEQN